MYNFNPGPAVLPADVIAEIKEDLPEFKGSGASILEASHRGPEYEALHFEAEANFRRLLAVPDDYAVLFLHGGASLQFAMVPMNLLPAGGTADYTASGAWAARAIEEARRLGRVHLAADCEAERPARVPRPEELRLTPGSAYLHITTNETISGAQWKDVPETGIPLVADMSSDVASRPVDIARFGLIYAGAQKNLGPAGVTVVLIRRDLAERAPKKLPAILRYATHIEHRSLYNTPACFAVYGVALMTRWMIREGGIEAIAARNRRKAARLYAAIDASGFYRGVAHPDFRSEMNVTFRLAGEAQEKAFVTEAQAAGFMGLKGHRSVGGLRASIYNAFPLEGVEALVEFMRDFERRRG